MSDFIVEFISSCLLMGLGIGLDAAMVTSLKASTMRSRLVAFIWVSGITFTHTVFPMIGYLLSHTGAKYFPTFSPIVGLLAFLLIGYYLLQELFYCADENDETHSDGQALIITIGLILAVSWDALWSGPAKSAQVIHWPETAVLVSFILVGFFVAVLSITALLIAQSSAVKRYLLGIRWLSTSDLEWFGRWCQYTIFGYFGLLALTRYTFQLDIAYELILLFCALVMALLLRTSAVLKLRQQLSDA